MTYLVETEYLKKYFPVETGFFRSSRSAVHAVDGINLYINQGETLGLAGESGCGKTTLGRLLLGLLKPTAGTVRFLGQDIFDFKGDKEKRFRRESGIIFQDPYASLNPRKTIREILSQPLRVHEICGRDEFEGKILELLKIVGLMPAQQFIDRFPHQFSGGQRQRIGIARVLATSPKFIVADEPVSSLDMSVRAQILVLIQKLSAQLRLSCLFITHDLSVLRSMSNRIAIMYIGKIVEISETEELFNNPLHPYTKALISSTPIPDPKSSRKRQRIILKGDAPSPIDPPPCCRFHARCPMVQKQCSRLEPQVVKVEKEHFVACHLYT